MKSPASRASYTIIELLIVFVFIAMFSSFSIGYYNRFTEEKKLENAGKKISTLLNLARAKSAAGDASMCKGVANSQVKYFSFTAINESQYSINPICLTGTPVPAMYTTESNIIFPTFLPPTPPYPVITFFPITGGSTCSYVYIKNTSLNRCRYVKTSESGLVNEGACSACNNCPAVCP